jgi:hypothetical protein
MSRRLIAWMILGFYFSCLSNASLQVRQSRDVSLEMLKLGLESHIDLSREPVVPV